MADQPARDAARVRDVPRACTCCWDFVRHRAAEPDHGVYRLLARWTRADPDPDCIWHKREMTP